MTVTVETLSPAQWARFRALRLVALDDSPDAFWATLEEERDRPESFWQRWLTTTTAFIASKDGQDVGLAMLGPSNDHADEAAVYAMWVAPVARRGGVGHALLRAAVDRATALGVRRVVLDVADHNGPAIRLYEQHGFAATGSRGAFPAPRDHITEHQLALGLDPPTVR